LQNEDENYNEDAKEEDRLELSDIAMEEIL
jgi:hypothetical protein